MKPESRSEGRKKKNDSCVAWSWLRDTELTIDHHIEAEGWLAALCTFKGTAQDGRKVAITGTIGVAEPIPGTMVYMYEGTSARGYFVHAEEDGGFLFEGVEIDLTDNCVEVWHEEPGAYGKKSAHSYFVASIAEDDQTVIVDQYGGSCGCGWP